MAVNPKPGEVRHRREHDRHELGSRAADGLAAENSTAWGRRTAPEEIRRRAGREQGAMKGVRGRTRW